MSSPADPANQAALIALLVEGQDRSAMWRVDVRQHASRAQGDRVVNYAQVRDQAAQDRVMARLMARDFFARNAALGTAHPGLYEVAVTIGG